MKRNFEKYFDEFHKLSTKEFPRFYIADFEDLIDLMISDDETLYNAYEHVHGCHASLWTLCYAAYQFGYVSAIRKMKSIEKKGQKK